MKVLKVGKVILLSDALILGASLWSYFLNTNVGHRQENIASVWNKGVGHRLENIASVCNRGVGHRLENIASADDVLDDDEGGFLTTDIIQHLIDWLHLLYVQWDMDWTSQALHVDRDF